MTEKDCYEIEYPSSRQLTFDVGRIGLAKHHVKALLEVDVSEAWRILREVRSSDRKISFTAWLIKVTADCAALHPPVAGAQSRKRNRVVVFNDVDVSMVLEKEVKGVRVPLPYVIRKADKKSLAEIQDEIDAAKAQSAQDEGDYVVGKKSSAFWMKLYTSLPQPLRLWMMRTFVLNHPQRTKASMGSVMITTVGMVGHTHGWIIPSSMHPLCLAFGSINEQPVVRRGEIVVGRILHLAVMVDHDVIDGIPAAMFVDDLVRKMEKGFGL